jgi:multidrug resistance efflux pump
MKRKTMVFVILTAMFGVGGYALWSISANNISFTISGTIEANDVHVGSKVGGRVLKVVAKEGQMVKAGETLVLLEPRELDVSLAEAQASLRQAEAKYAMMTAGFSKEEIEQAEAAAQHAKAELDQLLSGPRQQEVDQAAANWKAARAQADNARKVANRMEDLVRRDLVAQREQEEAGAKADEAEQRMRVAQNRYDLLLAGSRKEEIERARQRLAEADAKRRQLRGGFRKEEVAQAKSAMEAARARVDLIRTLLEETVIKAPVDALVESLDLETGDLVAAGKPVATLLRVGSLWVRAYLPDAQLRYAMPGLRVLVRVASIPSKDFSGVIRRVHRQGEPTPHNVPSREDRLLQVFQTEVVVEDPDHELRPGMNADVTIPKKASTVS